MATERLMLYGILGLTGVHCLWEAFVYIRQLHVYCSAVEVPGELRSVVDANMYEKSRSYGYIMLRFITCRLIYHTLFTASLIWLNGVLHSWTFAGGVIKTFGCHECEALQSAVFQFIMNTLYFGANFPCNVYENFVIERKHGSQYKTAVSFATGELLYFVMLHVKRVPFAFGAVYFVKAAGSYPLLWPVPLAALCIWSAVYSDYIAPYFDKYTPLPDGELKTCIEELAASVNFPLNKIYVVTCSTRLAHSSAYYRGLFKTKDIVLFDDLVQDYSCTTGATGEKRGCDNDGVVAVVAHELGHWKLNHVVVRKVIRQVKLLLTFVVFFALFKSEALYSSFGFKNEKPVWVGIFIFQQFIFTPCKSLLGFFVNCLYRSFEFDADYFVIDLRRGSNLRRALIKLYQDEMCCIAFPVEDLLFSVTNEPYPILLDRLKNLSKCE